MSFTMMCTRVYIVLSLLVAASAFGVPQLALRSAGRALARVALFLGGCAHSAQRALRAALPLRVCVCRGLSVAGSLGWARTPPSAGRRAVGR